MDQLLEDRKVWRLPIKDLIFERVYRADIEDEIQIPREFMKPDLGKIWKAIRKSKGQIKISGVKIWNEYIVYAR